MLTKTIGAVPHTGGKLFEKDHAFYGTLKGWLDAGAPDDAKDVAQVTGIEVFPQDIVLEDSSAQQIMFETISSCSLVSKEDSGR